MKTKHTKEYAEKLAIQEFKENSHGSRDLEIAIENSKIGFVKGYMKAIEDTEASNMLEALKTMVTCSNFVEDKKKYRNTKDHWTSQVEELLKRVDPEFKIE
jgi:hypothetical protein